MVVDDDFAGERAVCGIRDGGGAGDREAGIVADERSGADRGGAGEIEGFGQVGGKAPVLCGRGGGGGRGDRDEGDLGPEAIGSHEAGEHGREGGIGAGDDDAGGLCEEGRLRGWLWRAEVADVGLGGDVIEGGSGVGGKEGG